MYIYTYDITYEYTWVISGDLQNMYSLYTSTRFSSREADLGSSWRLQSACIIGFDGSHLRESRILSSIRAIYYRQLASKLKGPSVESSPLRVTETALSRALEHSHFTSSSGGILYQISNNQQSKQSNVVEKLLWKKLSKPSFRNQDWHYNWFFLFFSLSLSRFIARTFLLIRFQLH